LLIGAACAKEKNKPSREEREKSGVRGGLGRRAKLGGCFFNKNRPISSWTNFLLLIGQDHVIIFHIYLSPENYTKYALFIIKKVF